MEIKQTILGNIPSKSNCYKIIRIGGKCSLAKSDAVKKYEDNFLIQLNPKYRGLDIAGYFIFRINVFYPSERSDLDNSLKVVLDSLQAANVIRNDNKCISIIANKAKDKNNARIEFEIETI